MAQDRREELRSAAQRRKAELRSAEIRAKNADARANALLEAIAAELAARGQPVHAQPREAAAQRPEVERAIALLAHERGTAVSVGWSTGGTRYAGGTVLVDAGGVPVAVFDPMPGHVRGDAFLLLASLLLLFPPNTRR